MGKVESLWKSYDVQGRVAYVIKKKLKLLKIDLKKWNMESFENLEKQCKKLIAKVNFLEERDKVLGLTNEELETRRFCLGEYWKFTRMNPCCSKSQELSGLRREMGTNFFPQCY